MMDLLSIDEKKDWLESKILSLVHDFEDETGQRVLRITAYRLNKQPLSGVKIRLQKIKTI